ncbi:MAG: relaxase/mobilization nuclease domain-containing protein [Parasporobacterium sp.]|nr:relaxase/mobilization nuclease domain-containing protein [Parasporobacterium sp.]
MAINKVVPKAAKAHGGMRNLIEYGLRNEKVREGYVEITGPYDYDTINWDNVYNAFLEEKKMWDKDSGRMCAHNIISFHKDEKVSPAEVLEIGKQFVDRFFNDHQNLICVHQDKEHLHCHIITNTVSYIDGHKLHQNKRDLERQKSFTNQICRERGLTIAEKGKHFDGSQIEAGEVRSWSKDQYQTIKNDNGLNKKSYLLDCAAAVVEAKERSASKEEFISFMERSGWKTTWTKERKNITFEDQEGHKVRNTNLEKTFNLDLGKEALLCEFERQKAERERTERESREHEKYYAELERIETGLNTETAGNDLRAQLEASGKRIRHSDASVRTAETRRKNSSAERGNRETERKGRTVEQERSRTARKPKDHGLCR